MSALEQTLLSEAVQCAATLKQTGAVNSIKTLVKVLKQLPPHTEIALDLEHTIGLDANNNLTVNNLLN